MAGSEKPKIGAVEQGAQPLRARPSLLALGAFRAWLFFTVGVTAIFAFQGFYEPEIGPISNILPAVCAFIAFVSAVSNVRRYGLSLKVPFQAVWLCFAIGTGVWVLAETSWAVYYFVLNIAVPYPSIADVFYISGYLPMLAALVLYYRTFRRSMQRRRLAVAVPVIVGAVSLSLGLVIPLELSMNYPAIKIATDMIYPVLDLTLLSAAILSIAIFIDGTIGRYWGVLAGGIILYVLGDEFFLYQVANGSYYNGSVDDLFFLLGYLAFALAFYIHRREF